MAARRCIGRALPAKRQSKALAFGAARESIPNRLEPDNSVAGTA